MKKKKIISSILIIVVVSSTILINKKEEKEIKEINNLISYTVNGEKVKEKPSKETGYKARTITCDNKSNIVWDNTNWEAEIIKSETLDICNIDFTKEEDKLTYRVEINANITSGIDSISKTTIKNGNITFYPKNGYTITNVTGCSKGVIEEGTLVVKNITNKETCNITLESTTLKDKILIDHPIRSRRTDFIVPYIAENTKTLFIEDGLWTEGGLPVYYFAGNALDNWIIFGKDQEDNELYWRIIRTNEDGSIRLLYIGPDPATENAFIKIDGELQKDAVYNNLHDDTMYAGYMYGSEGSLENNRQNTTSSPIKLKTDEWYSKTINVKTDTNGNIYDKYVSKTAIYCNDRSGDNYDATGYMIYGSSARHFRPSYKCGNNLNGLLYSDNSDYDKFSGVNELAKLEYPIAQITSDEISYAGGFYHDISPVWYYYNSSGGSVTGNRFWWTMSPAAFDTTYDGTHMHHINGSPGPGTLDNWTVYTPSGIRPVLSLKSCVKWSSGDGSSSNPYTITIDSACSVAEN